MALPHAIARFNRRVTNRWIEPLMRRTAGFVIVHHIGRRTGRGFATPLYCFDDGDRVLVVLTYGARADWFRNVRGGGGSVERHGGRRPIDAVEVVDRSAASAALPPLVRFGLRFLGVHDLARLTLGDG